MQELKLSKHARERCYNRTRQTPEEALRDAEKFKARRLDTGRHPAKYIIIGKMGRYPVAENGEILTVMHS